MEQAYEDLFDDAVQFAIDDTSEQDLYDLYNQWVQHSGAHIPDMETAVQILDTMQDSMGQDKAPIKSFLNEG